MRNFLITFFIVACGLIAVMEFGRLSGGRFDLNFFSQRPASEGPAPGTPCSDLHDDYAPQREPQNTYAKELDLMAQGRYCYDLPIFDEAWRRRGRRVEADEALISDARRRQSGYRVAVSDDVAVIYYPLKRDIGPIFLKREGGRWIIDKTSMEKYVRFELSGTVWYALDGTYEYLPVLQKSLNMRFIERLDGTKGYQIT